METKYKEPIVGKLAIVWDIHNEIAIIELYQGYNAMGVWPHITNVGSHKNAILFENEEQYKEFIKS